MRLPTTILFYLLGFFFSTAGAQRYTTANGHAHNDYLNRRPFFLAYSQGFGSIEADVFPVGETLCVAHTKKEIDTLRTLDSLYLLPFLRMARIGQDQRPFVLLVDIKENPARSLALLLKALEPLQSYLSQTGKQGWMKIVISGSRPLPVDFRYYPSYIFFDDDLRQKHTTESWSRVGLVSLPFPRISKWNGKGRINPRDKAKLRHVIDSTHAAGKQIRFWAAPDNRRSWKLQKKLRADLIGTDKVTELARYLKKGRA